MRNQSNASPSATCGFGLCRQPATRRVETPTAIGGRIELLCATHAQRRGELEQVLADVDIDAPIPFTLTRKGRAAIGGVA